MLKKQLLKYKWSIIISMILVSFTVVAQLIQPQLLTEVLNDGIVNPMNEAGAETQVVVEGKTNEIICYLTKNAQDNCKSIEVGSDVELAYSGQAETIQLDAQKAYTKSFATAMSQGKGPAEAEKSAGESAAKSTKESIDSVMNSEDTKKFIENFATATYNEKLSAKKDDRNAIVTRIGALLVLFALIGLIAGVINTFISARVAQGIGANIRKEAFEKIQTYSLADVQKFSASGISVRLTNDIVQIQNLLMMAMQSIVRIPLLFIFSFVSALILVPEYWWIFLLFTISVVLVLVFAMMYMVPFFGKIQKSLEYVNRIIKENFNGIRVVKSFVQEEKEIKKVSNASSELTNYTIRVGVAFSLVVPLFFFIANAVSIAIFYFGVDILKIDPSKSGNIMSVITYLFMIMFALIIGGFLVMTLSRAMISIRRINEIMELQTSIAYNEVGQTPRDGSIEFKNVSFSYESAIGEVEQSDDAGNARVKSKAAVEHAEKIKLEPEYDLKNISFKIESGEVIGVVGTTGSGKSTLVKLIPRLYDPTIGSIEVGSVELKEISKITLRERIAIVMQKAMLFSGDIQENIKHGKRYASESDMLNATSIAQAKEFIDRLELGLNAPVYERGSNFSGGQKQRLSMSRGFVKDASIIILDDSTSALDAKSEKLVQEAIEHKLSNTTVVIVAQKISSVINADKIIVLEEGKLAGFGTHKQLLSYCRPYVEIYDTQKGKGGNQ